MTAKKHSVDASVLQENLAKGLSIVGRAVSTRSTLPVLANILVEAGEDGRVKLAATNLEICISCMVGAKVAQPFAVTLPAKTFADLVGAFSPERVDFAFNRATQTMHLACARTEANLKGIDAAEFPMIPVMPDSDHVVIKSEVLKRLIAQVAFAAANDDTKPILAGVLTTMDGKSITMVTTDGFRLSEATGELVAAATTPVRIVIPAKSLTELGKVIGDEEEVAIAFPPGAKQVVFSVGAITLVSQLIDGNYPDYKPVIPKSHRTRTVVGRGEMLRAVKQSAIFAREASNTMSMRVNPGTEIAAATLHVNGSSSETGDNLSVVDATVTGEEIVINLNAAFLTQVIGAIGTPQIAIQTNGPTEPAVLLPVGENGFRHIIMPMQIGR